MEQGWLLLGRTQMERMEAHLDSMQENYVLFHTEHTCARSDPSRRTKVLLALAVAIMVTSVMGIVAFLVCQAKEPACQEDVQKVYDDGGIYIQFGTISDINDNEFLEFGYETNKNVSLVDKKEIHIFCNGPYILHMYVCSKGLDDHHGQGRLELRLAETQAALTNLSLEGGRDAICKGLHTTVYLRRKEKATFHFSSEGQTLKIKNITLGLRYLLGQCQF